MKKIIALILALAMALSLVACAAAPANNGGSNDNAPADNGGANAPADDGAADAPADSEYPSQPQFANVQVVVSSFFEPMEAGCNDAAADLGIPKPEFYINNSGSIEEWCSIIDTLVARGVDGIFTAHLAGAAVTSKSLEIKEAGIYEVCSANADVVGSGCEFSWCTDVGEAAYQGALRLAEALGNKGNIVHLAADPSDPNTIARQEGVERACKETGLVLINTIGSVDDAELAQNAVNNLLSTGEKVDGIIATGGGSTIGLAQALRQGDIKNIKAIGCDTDIVTLDAIKDGYLTGTIAQNSYGMGYAGLVTLYLYSQGYTYKYPEQISQDSGYAYIDITNYDKVDEILKELTVEIKNKVYEVMEAPAN